MAAAAPAVPLLRVDHVSKMFGGVRALDDVSFELREGEVHCLAGENGSGKSTLIKLISGVYRPEPGAAIRFGEREFSAVTPAIARELGVQVIWQDLALFSHLTVAENIAFEQNLGGRFRWVRRRNLREAARATLSRLGFAIDVERPLMELSIAQRQLVAIARALVADARIVFMDEPTASTTQAETRALFEVVRKLSADGIAVVFVSHRLAEVMAIAERVTVLRDGRQVGVFRADEMSPARLTELMTGRQFDESVHARDRSRAGIVLKAEALSRDGEYEDISFQLHAGEILGITGLLGAGRTELASTLFGLNRPDRGRFLLNGEECRFGSNRGAIDAGIAYVPEDRLTLGLVQAQSIADNTVMAAMDRIASTSGVIDGRRKSHLVGNWIGQLAIRVGEPDDPVRTLSGGNQQRVVLAKWLATEPKVLILDSPTVGVDVGARAGIFAIVRELAEAGIAIILISDEIPEVYQNADRVLHMRGGRLVDAYDPRSARIETIEAAVHG